MVKQARQIVIAARSSHSPNMNIRAHICAEFMLTPHPNITKSKKPDKVA
ncbi:hypothetical protein DSLASN_02860 [Desulfoluna limicola]|uniref:Uncharacterized protein n=1 Tax=Desulfoluna limicola TaxID=2810562 RepID=A0ABM7PBX9_9BACT|nr:hypothetical protein DSLASN_02860 [Desulfoluna limicola]